MENKRLASAVTKSLCHLSARIINVIQQNAKENAKGICVCVLMVKNHLCVRNAQRAVVLIKFARLVMMVLLNVYAKVTIIRSLHVLPIYCAPSFVAMQIVN